MAPLVQDVVAIRPGPAGNAGPRHALRYPRTLGANHRTDFGFVESLA